MGPWLWSSTIIMRMGACIIGRLGGYHSLVIWKIFFIVTAAFTLYPKDVDECRRELDDCHPNADCIDVPGSFTCSCKSGYIGDGKLNCTGKF